MLAGGGGGARPWRTTPRLASVKILPGPLRMSRAEARATFEKNVFKGPRLTRAYLLNEKYTLNDKPITKYNYNT